MKLTHDILALFPLKLAKNVSNKHYEIKAYKVTKQTKQSGPKYQRIFEKKIHSNKYGFYSVNDERANIEKFDARCSTN